MSATAINLAELKLIPLLQTTFGENAFAVGNGSPCKPTSEHVKIGTINSLMARRLLTVHSELVDAESKMSKEFAHFLVDNDNPRDDKIMDFKRRHRCLVGRREIMHSLLWQAIIEENRDVFFNEQCTVADGWDLYSEGDWESCDMFTVKSGPLYNFVDRLKQIVLGQDLLVPADFFEPRGADEPVLGELEDAMTMSIASLAKEISNDTRNHLPKNLLGLDEEKFRKAIGDLTVNEARKLLNLKSYTLSIFEIISDIFWDSVREAMPAAKDEPSIGLRKGWKVVRPVRATAGHELVGRL